ncbi:uncharacterized protein LOC142216757 [Leptodactylus fuscus]|uniref:uncharacterized protein LOC142216757 n=1 Tax=Leptodactylus fuscus TaxID=238119 RepID=UPI003F4EADFF
MDDAERRQKIQAFTFDRCKRGNQGFERILLQLFGFVGHGKSSFINSVICAWSNSEYKNYANAAGIFESHTMERLAYSLTENIVLVDNRGFCKMNAYETGEIFAQLGNLLPLDQAVDWSEGFGLADRIVEAEPHVKASDFIIPIFVYSVTQSPTPGLREDLIEIIRTATKLTMVTPIVVLTHKNHKNYTKVNQIFRDLGIEKIFSLENYTDENTKMKREAQEEVIMFLYEVINDAQFYVDHPHDADQEMTDRKLFLLNYIHDRELMIQKTDLERQSNEEKIVMEKAFKRRQEEEKQLQQKCQELHEENMKRLQQEFDKWKRK